MRYCLRCGHEHAGEGMRDWPRAALYVALTLIWVNGIAAAPISTLIAAVIGGAGALGWREFQRSKALQARFDWEGYRHGKFRDWI